MSAPRIQVSYATSCGRAKRRVRARVGGAAAAVSVAMPAAGYPACLSSLGGLVTTGRLRAIPRGTLLLGLAIVAVFAAVASNVAESVRHSHWRKRDRAAFVRWAGTHGGRRSYGVAVPETHARYDVVCAPHFPNRERRHGADYWIKLLVDPHGDGEPRVVRAALAPLKVVPTATGPKCGAAPAAP